jgi:selenocysteine lyase/cysteine desulfurase
MYCYPAVSNNEARIRASVLATHSESDIDGFVNAMNEINEKLHFKEFSSRKNKLKS